MLLKTEHLSTRSQFMQNNWQLRTLSPAERLVKSADENSINYQVKKKKRELYSSQLRILTGEADSQKLWGRFCLLGVEDTATHIFETKDRTSQWHAVFYIKVTKEAQPREARTKWAAGHRDPYGAGKERYSRVRRKEKPIFPGWGGRHAHLWGALAKMWRRCTRSGRA